MFLHRRPLARFRWQEAEPAIYLQPYIPDDLGELAASEMPQLGSTQGLLDMMGGGSSAEEEGGPPRKQRRLEETAPGARPAPPEEVAEEIAPTEVDPASSPASVPSSPASAPRAAVVPLHAPRQRQASAPAPARRRTATTSSSRTCGARPRAAAKSPTTTGLIGWPTS